jgi:hypothetical protein
MGGYRFPKQERSKHVGAGGAPQRGCSVCMYMYVCMCMYVQNRAEDTMKAWQFSSHLYSCCRGNVVL